MGWGWAGWGHWLGWGLVSMSLLPLSEILPMRQNYLCPVPALRTARGRARPRGAPPGGGGRGSRGPPRPRGCTRGRRPSPGRGSGRWRRREAGSWKPSASLKHDPVKSRFGSRNPSSISHVWLLLMFSTQDTRQSPNSQGAVHHLLITMCTATKLPPPPPTASWARAGATFVTRPRQEITVTDRSVAPWRMDFQRGAVDTQTSL